MTQQPDLLNDSGVELMIYLIDNKKDNEIRKLLLKWVRECCVMHEMNRYVNETCLSNVLIAIVIKLQTKNLRRRYFRAFKTDFS